MSRTQTGSIIIDIQNVSKSFMREGHQDMLVLNSIYLQLLEGEIVALLGKSGSGKSTLLRIISGLIEPSDGQVFYRNTPVKGPASGIAMVFQNFALLPWLTVLENVELGLEAQGVPKEVRRKRALAAIDIIGLDGFESAYPKELSGGMRQRVGFARALVVDPDILLMDEPFSALDVLTADNLKSDLMDIWLDQKTKTSAILFVTHNIEEAALLADRIIIFDSNPGRIHAELRPGLSHPRDTSSPDYLALIDRIYTIMTTRVKGERLSGMRDAKERLIGVGYRLPDTNSSELTGLLEIINEPQYQGRMDLPELADLLSMDIDDLFHITDVLQILNFARVSSGDIELTEAGKEFIEAEMLERKKIFADHLLKYVPLAKYIKMVIDKNPEHSVWKDDILSVLEPHLSDKEAQRVLRVAIDWGRYAEIFAYDDDTGVFSLENPD